jgi:soluble lytic murein transglycosylase-like protein
LLLAGTVAILGLTFTQETIYAGYKSFSDVKLTYEDYILESNPSISKKDAREIVLATYTWANANNIEAELLLAISKVESTFNKYAISPSGAYGLMQVIPVWHKDKIIEAKRKLGNPEIFNINTNIFLGASVLRNCLNTKGSIDKALLCYSGQTEGYDKKVLSEYKAIKEL